MSDSVNYGPLESLIGVWKGNKGVDVAPEPTGEENTPYHETLTFTAIGDVKNANSQVLAVLRYHQVVQRQSDDAVFHDEVGYWMWDAATDVVMHSLAIPRAVTLLAGGHHSKLSDEKVVLEVFAEAGHEKWDIIQSPFMSEKAKTTSFNHTIEVSGNTLKYHETTMLDIYGKKFEHTDNNELIKQ